MSAAVPAPDPRRSTAMYFLLGVAVLVGIVAVFLSGAAPASAPSQAGQLVVNLPPVVWGLLFLSPLAVGIGGILVQRVREGSLGVPRRVFVACAVMLLLALVFIYILSGVPSTGGGTVQVRSGGGGTGSSPTPPSNPSTPPVNGTNVSAPFTVVISLTTLLAVVGGLSVCVAVLTIPGVLSRLIDRGRAGRPLPSVRPGVAQALAEAGAAIDRGEDLRETVVRLYVRLLIEIAPRVGDVSYLTADEIRREVLAGLGVTPAASEALTRSFEEARYSTHAIGPAEAGRFREAIRQVEHDLHRSAAS